MVIIKEATEKNHQEANNNDLGHSQAD